MINLGFSLGRSNTSILSLSPGRYSPQKLGMQKMLTVQTLDNSFDRVDEDPMERKST